MEETPRVIPAKAGIHFPTTHLAGWVDVPQGQASRWPAGPSAAVGSRRRDRLRASPLEYRNDGIVWLLARLGPRELYRRSVATRAARPCACDPSQHPAPLHLRRKLQTQICQAEVRRRGTTGEDAHPPTFSPVVDEVVLAALKAAKTRPGLVARLLESLKAYEHSLALVQYLRAEGLTAQNLSILF